MLSDARLLPLGRRIAPASPLEQPSKAETGLRCSAADRQALRITRRLLHVQRLFPDHRSSETTFTLSLAGNNVASLGWVRGECTRSESGATNGRQGIFDTVTEIVRERYAATGSPCPSPSLQQRWARHRLSSIQQSDSLLASAIPVSSRFRKMRSFQRPSKTVAQEMPRPTNWTRI